MMIDTRHHFLLSAAICIFLCGFASAARWVSVEDANRLPENVFAQRVRGSSKRLHFCIVQVSTGQYFVGTLKSGTDFCEYVVAPSAQSLENFEVLKVHKEKKFKVLILDPREKVVWVSPKQITTDSVKAVSCPVDDGAPFASCHLARSLSSDGLCSEGIGKALSIPSSKYSQVHVVWKNGHSHCPFYLLMGLKTI